MKQPTRHSASALFSNASITTTGIMLVALLLCSCRHQAPRQDGRQGGWLPGTKSRESLKIATTGHDLPAVNAGKILSEPATYDRQPLRIRGHVADVQLRDLPRDMTALVLFIHDPVAPAAAPPAPVAPIVARLDLEQQLNPIPEALLQAAPKINRDTLNREQFRHRYFELKSSGSRIRALSNYLAANGAADLALGTNQLASGLQLFADGYRAIADLTPSPDANKLQLESQPSELVVPVPPGAFDRQLDLTAGDLQALAEHLVNHRDQLLAGELSLAGDGLDPRSGFVLISAGNLYDAAAWRDRGADNPTAAELNQQLSLAYLAFGRGINELNTASNQLAVASRQQIAANQPAIAPEPVTSIPRDRLLKCAVVGWNRSVLDEAANRLRRFNGIPIDVEGTVMRSNFREELNQTWVAMSTVQLDGLAIDLNYDDRAGTTQNINDVYNWISETAN